MPRLVGPGASWKAEGMPAHSAGLLPYRFGEGRTLEVLVVHPGGPFWANKDDGTWSIAKGEYEPGQDPEEAANREFAEELGQGPPTGPRIDLGELRQPSGKLVRVWAVEGDLDVENVTISCRNLGFEVNYSRLADLFARVACSLSLHAVLSVDAGDRLDRAHMENAGFHVHTRLIRYLPGGRKTANADNLFAFKAGAIVSRSRADVVVLGTGDGQLCDDVVQCIKALPGSRQVLTLSVAGSTSSFLNARTHSSIAANIEIGKDLLAPLYAAAAS